MARGIIGGMVFGSLVSVGAAGVISVVLDPPTRPEAVVVAPDTTEAPQANVPEGGARFGDADLVRDATAPVVSAPAPEDAAPLSAASSDTPSVPETGAAIANLEETEATALATVGSDPDEPVLPAPQASLPEAPAGVATLSISTDPSQPAPPPPAAESATSVVARSSVDLPEPEVPTLALTDLLGGETTVAPVLPVAPDFESAALTTEAAPEGPAAKDQSDLPAGEAELSETVAEAEKTATPAPETPEATDVSEAERPADAEGAANGRVQIGRPATSLIGRDAESGTEPEAEDTGEEAESIASAPSGPPLEAFAEDFDNPEQKPLMSIVLMDDGGTAAGQATSLAALKEFPFPLTFAVNVFAEDARERMQTYRKAGYEVLALMDLPARATATDAEINILAAFETMPEVVGLMEGTKSGLQESRPAAEQLVAALKDTGHGFVLQSKGLNAIQQVAEREGVPAQVVFRDFDSAGQTARVIRRFLDQAAFRAGQEGAVVMLGRLRPDTISALLLWGFQDRAQRVALAPISAVLSQ